MGALERVGVLLLPASDLLPGFWALASSSCSVRLTRRLTPGLHRVVRNLGAIAKEEEKDQGRNFSK